MSACFDWSGSHLKTSHDLECSSWCRIETGVRSGQRVIRGMIRVNLFHAVCTRGVECEDTAAGEEGVHRRRRRENHRAVKRSSRQTNRRICLSLRRNAAETKEDEFGGEEDEGRS